VSFNTKKLGMTRKRLGKTPNAGPIMPEIFSCSPPSVAVDGSSLLERISG
jgi:hypothetical protein